MNRDVERARRDVERAARETERLLRQAGAAPSDRDATVTTVADERPFRRRRGPGTSRPSGSSFRLTPELAAALEAESNATATSKVAIVEAALRTKLKHRLTGRAA